MENINRKRWSNQEVELLAKFIETTPNATYKTMSEFLKANGYTRTAESVRHFFRGNIKSAKVAVKKIESIRKGFDPEDYLQDLIEFQKKHIVDFSSSRKSQDVAINPSYIELNIDTDTPIAITFLSDLHIGNPYCDYEGIVEAFEAISEYDNHYIYLGGDSIDNFIVSKLQQQTDKQIIDVDKQWRLVEYLIDKYKDSILCVGDGNHERFTDNLAFVNLRSFMDLRHKVIFTGGDGAYLHMYVGNTKYKIHVMHKLNTGNSRINRHLAHKNKYNYAIEGDLDVIVQEHYHEGDMETFWRHGKKRLAINCGTFKMYDVYAKQLSYDHYNNSSPTVVFYSNKRKLVYFDYYEDAQVYMRSVNNITTDGDVEEDSKAV